MPPTSTTPAPTPAPPPSSYPPSGPSGIPIAPAVPLPKSVTSRVQQPLTPTERQILKNELNWTDEIIDRDPQEAKLAALVNMEIKAGNAKPLSDVLNELGSSPQQQFSAAGTRISELEGAIHKIGDDMEVRPSLKMQKYLADNELQKMIQAREIAVAKAAGLPEQPPQNHVRLYRGLKGQYAYNEKQPVTFWSSLETALSFAEGGDVIAVDVPENAPGASLSAGSGLGQNYAGTKVTDQALVKNAKVIIRNNRLA